MSLDLNRIFLKDKNYMPVLLLFCEQSRETDFDLDLLTETRTVRSQDSTKKFFLSNTDGSLCEDGKKARFLFGEKVKDLRKLSLNLTIFPCYGLKKVSRNFNYLKSLFEICLSGFKKKWLNWPYDRHRRHCGHRGRRRHLRHRSY